MVTIIRMMKVVWTAWRNKPSQEFVNELYAHEQAKFYQRHAGIGDGGKSLQGKYLNSSTKKVV